MSRSNLGVKNTTSWIPYIQIFPFGFLFPHLDAALYQVDSSSPLPSLSVSPAHTTLLCPASVLWEKHRAQPGSGTWTEPQSLALPGVLVLARPERRLAPPLPSWPLLRPAMVHAVTVEQSTAASRPCIFKEALFQATLHLMVFQQKMAKSLFWGYALQPLISRLKRQEMSGDSACEFGFLPMTREGWAGWRPKRPLCERPSSASPGLRVAREGSARREAL